MLIATKLESRIFTGCEQIAGVAGATSEQRLEVAVLETLAIGNLCFHLELLTGYRQAVNEVTGLASKHSKVQGSDIFNAELAEFRH